MTFPGGTAQRTGWRVAVLRVGRSLDRRLGLLVGGESLDIATELGYYIWCLRDAEGDVTVIDAGFGRSAAEQRGIVDFQPVPEALATIGVDPESVGTVVLSHLHWDHAGDIGAFPNASFVVSRAEWAWTHSRARSGGAMFDELWDRECLADLASLPAERIVLVDRARVLAGGVTARVVGGHTVGHVVVDVSWPGRNPMLILSDLAYLYANLERRAAPLICHDRWHTRDLYEELASGGAQLFPGHDPAILTKSERIGANVAVW